MHITASEAMRLTCVYAGTLGTSRKKENRTVKKSLTKKKKCTSKISSV
jgi:hypothetical protein